MSTSITSFNQAVQSLQEHKALRVDGDGGNLHAVQGLEKIGLAFQRHILRRSPEQLGTNDAAIAKALTGLYRSEHAGATRLEVARQLDQAGLKSLADLLEGAPALEKRQAAIEPGVPLDEAEPVFQTVAEARQDAAQKTLEAQIEREPLFGTVAHADGSARLQQAGVGAAPRPKAPDSPLPAAITPQRLAAAVRHGRNLAVQRQPELAAPVAKSGASSNPAVAELVRDLRNGSISDQATYIARVFPLISERLGADAAGVINIRSDAYYAHLGEKARYSDIGVPRHSAVALASGEPVHANRVPLGGLGDPSIAAQAPKSSTLNDFISLLQEQKIETIVDLTNLDDKQKRKVPDYGRDPAHGITSVDRTSPDLRGIGVEKRELALQEQPVAYLNFTRWVDHGVPDLQAFSQLVSAVATEHQGKQGGLLIHCTAGVGRTGTLYAGLELARLARNGDLSPGNVQEKVLDVVAEGRRARGLAFVQAPAQLALLFDYADSLLH